MYISKQTTFVSLVTLATGVSLGYTISNSSTSDPVPSNAENLSQPSATYDGEYDGEAASQAAMLPTQQPQQQQLSEIPIPEVPEIQDSGYEFEWQESLENQLGHDPLQQPTATKTAANWSQSFFGKAPKTSFNQTMGLSEDGSTSLAARPSSQRKATTQSPPGSSSQRSQSQNAAATSSRSHTKAQQVATRSSESRSQQTTPSLSSQRSQSQNAAATSSRSHTKVQQVATRSSESRSQQTTPSLSSQRSQSQNAAATSSRSHTKAQQVATRGSRSAYANNSQHPQVRPATGATGSNNRVAPTAPEMSSSQPQLARSPRGSRGNAGNFNNNPSQVSSSRSYPSQQGTAADLMPRQSSQQTVATNTNDNRNNRTSDRTSNTETASQQSPVEVPDRQKVSSVRSQLDNIAVPSEVNRQRRGSSPGLTIAVPSGFGADRNTLYTSATYQSETRFSNKEDGAAAIGFGFGNADEAVGVELSYTMASFGRNRDFGSGGFNLKVHRRLPDDVSVAAGWNGFLNIGDDNDFEDSLYGSASKVFRLKDDINKPFSRVAVTAGIGNGQFRTEEAVDEDEEGINPFGSVSVRLARPVSAVVEWTGQDLSLGASVTPFENIPITITPAVRDVAGAGDDARFVLGIGMGYQF